MLFPRSRTSTRHTIGRTFTALGLATWLLVGTGCTWVKVSEEAAAVDLVPASRVRDCRKIGSASTSVKDSIAGISRNGEKVLSELDALARQEAVDMGANTLVREEAGSGAASYSVYVCP